MAKRLREEDKEDAGSVKRQALENVQQPPGWEAVAAAKHALAEPLPGQPPFAAQAGSEPLRQLHPTNEQQQAQAAQQQQQQQQQQQTQHPPAAHPNQQQQQQQHVPDADWHIDWHNPQQVTQLLHFLHLERQRRHGLGGG